MKRQTRKELIGRVAELEQERKDLFTRMDDLCAMNLFKSLEIKELKKLLKLQP